MEAWVRTKKQIGPVRDVVEKCGCATLTGLISFYVPTQAFGPKIRCITPLLRQCVLGQLHGFEAFVDGGYVACLSEDFDDKGQ